MSRKSGRRFGRRWQGVLLLAALAATLLAGCAGPMLPPLPWQAHTPAPLPAAQQTIRVAMPSSGNLSAIFDPINASNSAEGPQIASLLYSGLLTLNARQQPIAALATSYSVSADGLRYTFHLRPDARFVEGTPLTSADVAFSLNRAMSRCALSQAQEDFFDVKDQPAFPRQCIGEPLPGQPTITTLIGDALLTPDPQTLVIVLARPDGALLAKLAEPYSLIVERSFVTSHADQTTNADQWTTSIAAGGQGTSGMYSVAAWTPWDMSGIAGSIPAPASLTLRASRAYWGQQPMLRQVTFTLRFQQSNCATPQTTAGCEFYALQPSDQIALDTWPLDLYTLQTTASGLHFSSAPGDTIDLLALDPQTPPLDDARVRQALALALDKRSLAKADEGMATNHLVPPGVGDYPAALSGPLATASLSGDLARAQTLWQSYVTDTCGGVASRCPALTVFEIGPLSVTTPLEAAVMARWRAALPGIRLTQPIFPGTLISVGNYPPPSAVNVVSVWEEYPDPQNWLRPVTDVPGDPQFDPTLPNYVHDAKADALVARAEAALAPTARLALYQQAENALINDAVVIPIAQTGDGWGIRSNVVNFPASAAPYIAPAAWARIYLTAPAGK